MNIFKKFFSQIFYPEHNEPNVLLGKYSDRNKLPQQLENWKQALSLYKEEKYFEFFINFLQYVKDPYIDNLSYQIENKKIDFKFYQGSKIIYGTFTEEGLYAYSDVAEFLSTNEQLLKFLLQENFNLKFSKFVLTSNTIRLEVYRDLKNLHPIILYSALRELAITADGFDDVLVDKYDFLKPIGTHHIKPLSELETKVKIKYFKLWIKNTLEYVEKLDKYKQKGAISFMLLALTYKIFYLISPEAVLLEQIKKIHQNYVKNNDNILEANNFALSKFKELQKLSDKQIKESLYFVKGTFPVGPPTDMKTIINFAQREIDKVHWYRENQYQEVAKAIAEYIIGFLEFNFSLEPILEKLFRIFWQITNYDFFVELGFKNNFFVNNKINFFAINHKISKLTQEYKKNYPNFYFNVKHLNLLNVSDFAISFIYELINSNLYEP